jgi:hypothetical protein
MSVWPSERYKTNGGADPRASARTNGFSLVALVALPSSTDGSTTAISTCLASSNELNSPALEQETSRAREANAEENCFTTLACRNSAMTTTICES